MNSSKRGPLLFMLASALIAYAFYSSDTFWGIVVCGIVFLWSAIQMLPTMDVSWRMRVGLAVSAFGLAFICLWPTLDTATGGKIHCPQYVRDRVTFAIAPGLDLRGGLRLVYTVEVEEAIRDKRDRYADDMRQELATVYGIHSGSGVLKREETNQLAAKVKVAAPAAEPNVIRVKFAEGGDVAKIDDRFNKKFANELSQAKGPGADEVTFRIKSDVESQIRERAVAQAKDTVMRRVDELGLREASVTNRDEDIIVEVPGQDQKAFEEIKDIIRRTARLEFKMVDDEADFFGKVKETPELSEMGLRIEQEAAPAGPGKTVPSHYAVLVKRPNESMPDALKRFKTWTATLGVPDDHQVGFEARQEPDPDTQKLTDIGWRTVYLFSRAEVTGDYISDASRAIDSQKTPPEYYVALTFSPQGADRFEEVTGANVQRRFAIILDDIIDSAPVIRSKIGGGHASITMGAGDPEEQLRKAEKLELVLKSGALPAPITPSNESVIGPTLGRDAIGEALKGAVIGSMLVLAFMIFYYRKAGLVADVAVLLNLFLQMAVLASFSATMTLPGIAGLALTIGMSVDANVLINERIREELRAGRSVRQAVEAGYEKAFSSIVDGHVTVLISGLILAQYGTGPVKGFAVTLIVGIICSMYTGVFFTRLVFDWWARGAKLKRLSVGAEF